MIRAFSGQASGVFLFVFLFVLEILKCSHGVGELEVCCASLEIAVVFLSYFLDTWCKVCDLQSFEVYYCLIVQRLLLKCSFSVVFLISY